MKVTIDQLEKTRREMALRYEAARAVYEKKTAKYKAEFSATVNKYQEKWDALAEAYFNENLVDRKGRTVSIGDIITDDGSTFYRVKKRQMSGDHKGSLTFAFIVCAPIQKNKGKEAHISSHNLRSFDVKIGKAVEA